MRMRWHNYLNKQTFRFNILLYNDHYEENSIKNVNFYGFNQKHITQDSRKHLFLMLNYLHKLYKNIFHHHHFNAYESITKNNIYQLFNLIVIYTQFIHVSHISIKSHT